ncbi:Eco57I restriction-modification methylase domain-containing protein [Shewanella xiamenensis]|uniref:Eco57I restriction-modification methylase domain-containing protein n=1 Tax=Shewanella TaxID=22 RepID=UPI0021D916B9|nr:Eco57I restriction-modification methylase domain-containing protein [Shewanella sp. SM55]MCU8063406.1 Eco57I restriction-modification methylase domain-containing protein [Shewanella sp. SM55]
MSSTITIEDVSKHALIWGESSSEKGEIFTKPEIVQFMLCTSGVSRALLNPDTQILEPSCGQGAFVHAIAEELCLKIKASNKSELLSAGRFLKLITAYDISNDSIAIAKRKTYQVLRTIFDDANAQMLVNEWYKNDDFLLNDSSSFYTHIVGNPPYVRIENIPYKLLDAYRNKFVTMKERADLYVAFYEKSLSLLKENGVLSFICTDRWTKNSYGSSLRKYIDGGYQLDLYVDMYGQDAFQSEVLTYPAITQISRRKKSQAIIIHNPKIDNDFSQVVAQALLDDTIEFAGKIVRKDVVSGSKPWMFGSSDELELIKRLERDFPLIEDTGCQIFIGAATGNNKVYVVDENVDIESSRKIPMVKAVDIKNGYLNNYNQFIINTYDNDGVINLDNFPKLKKYLESYGNILKSRYISKKSPSAWFKTIDRVYPERAKAEKLLIPDIKSQLTVVYDEGVYHPNNSIYYICSKYWNLKALQAVLISGIGQIFVEGYSTKVSGGNLRFQAQHLRRIRLPLWDSVSEDLRLRLEQAAIKGDISAAKELVCSLYCLSDREKQVLGC